MWSIGYLVVWGVVIWFIVMGVLMTFIGSQFDKVLGWAGIVFIALGGAGAWKLMHMVTITVNQVG